MARMTVRMPDSLHSAIVRRAEAEGVSLKTAATRALEIADELSLPKGYVVYDGGGLETLQEGDRLGGQLLALAIFLVLVVMAVQYESLRNPVVILLSVPFTLAGVAIGLRVTGLPVSMPVWLGVIMLAGIVVNNAIVLVDLINQLRAQGVERTEAIMEAGKARLRPILMTSLTTALGLLPMAMGFGEGSEVRTPMAITVIGGLTVSTLLTLVVIPVVYSLMDRKRLQAAS